MEYSWRRKTYYNNQKPLAGRSKGAINAPCKKHPKHRQSPGVCSICLRKKLSQLSSNANNHSSLAKKYTLSSSSSSSYISSSSSDASSYSSPIVSYTRRLDSEGRKSMRVFAQNILKKSRSMAFVLQRRNDHENGKNIEIKLGFWSKFLSRRNYKGLKHSRTIIRERVIAEVHYYWRSVCNFLYGYGGS